MTERSPLVSVVMPVFNAGQRLGGAVMSILLQTFHDLELIAVDDGSTDASGAVLDRIAADDSRMTVVHTENAGVSSARNVGIRRARAPYVAMMDSDDISHPTRLERQRHVLEQNPEIAAVGCGLRILNSLGEVIRLDPVQRWAEVAPEPFHGRFDIAGPTLMVRRQQLERVAGYRRVMRYADDYDLIVRLIDEGYVLANIEERLYDYVVHSGQTTELSGAEQLLDVIAANLSRECRRRGLPDPLDDAEDLTSTLQGLDDQPRDLRNRFKAVRAIADHFKGVRRARQAGTTESGAGMIARGLPWGARTCDIMAGIHRNRYHTALRDRRVMMALGAGLQLAVARRRPRCSPDEVILPRS